MYLLSEDILAYETLYYVDNWYSFLWPKSSIFVVTIVLRLEVM